MLSYQILEYDIEGKIWKSHTKTTNLKYQLQRGMINLNYLMNHILYQIWRLFSGRPPDVTFEHKYKINFCGNIFNFSLRNVCIKY